LLVRDGFLPTEAVEGGRVGRRLAGLLPPDWNRAENCWLFEYCR
jgi:hypothetical protein